MAPPGATISAPASATTSPSTSRGNKLSRKSGLSVALQSQNLVHPQPTQPNGTAKSNNHARRNPEQTHLRHHSMPTQQQRPASANSSKSTTNEDKKVTILKRSSTTTLAAAPSTAQNTCAPATHSPKQQQQQQQKNHFKQQQQQQQKVNNQHTPSKARRVQRRKEIEADQESLAKAELDVASMEHSPPLRALASPPSSTDSDDSESGSSRSFLTHHQVNNKGNRSSKNNAATRHQLATSPPQRPSSAPVLPQSRKGMPAPAVTPHQTGYRGHHNLSTPQPHQQQFQGNVQLKASFGSASTLSLDSAQNARPNVAKTTSADKVVLADRVAAEKAKLYAGPTFHNSPAPTSLPIPAFSRSVGGSPMEPAVETLPTTSFPEASSPRLNSSRQRTQSDTYGFNTMAPTTVTKPMSVPGYPVPSSQQGYPLPYSHHPVFPAPPQHHHVPHFDGGYPHPQPNHGYGYGYNVPDRMATSSFSPVNNDGEVDRLMEISQNLRTLLKIQSQ